MKPLINHLSDCLRVLFNPRCWLQNDPYSPAWDAKLTNLLKEHAMVIECESTARIGDQVVWIANHPFASFTPYDPKIEVRPKRITILRAGDLLEKDPYVRALKLLETKP